MAKYTLCRVPLLATAVLLLGTRADTPTVIPPETARNYVGREVVVDGTVVQVSVSRRSETTFLNFGAPYPNHTFTAVIFKGNRSLFPKVREWEGKRLRISGKVRLYRGKPEIILDRAEQVRP